MCNRTFPFYFLVLETELSPKGYIFSGPTPFLVKRNKMDKSSEALATTGLPTYLKRHATRHTQHTCYYGLDFLLNLQLLSFFWFMVDDAQGFIYNIF